MSLYLFIICGRRHLERNLFVGELPCVISLLLVWYLCTKYLFAFAIFILSHYEHMYLN